MLIEKRSSASSGPSIVIRHEYKSVERLLKLLKPGEIGLIWGQPAVDEYIAFAGHRKIRGYMRIISDQGSYVTGSVASRSSRMYARDRYKVSNFLLKEFPFYSKVVIRDARYEVLEFCRKATWEDLVLVLTRDYVSTRRVKRGAERDISMYLDAVRLRPPVGNMVMNLSWAVRYDDILCMWLALHQDISAKIVICATPSQNAWLKPEFISKSIEGEYLDAAELLRQVQNTFNLTEQTVQSAFRIWKKSLDGGDVNLLATGRITAHLASKFADAISDTELDVRVDSDVLIPSQNIAPLRFKIMDGVLDILLSREHSKEDAKVRGGAKTCWSATEDISGYGGFNNAIPNFDRRIARIQTILDNIIHQDYDDALVVQLGTEVSALESRILGSREQLGDGAFQESATFFATLYGFLSQFHIWSDYKTSISSSRIDKDERAYVTSRDILLDIAEQEDVSTQNTQERIESFIRGLDIDGMVLMQREGAVLSAENIASQGAAEVAGLSRDGGVPVGPEGRDLIQNANKSGLANWFIENIPKLRALALSKELDWLSSFLDKLEG